MSEFFSGFNWTSLGIDAGIIVAIVGLCEIVKRKVFKKKTPTWAVIVVDLILSIAAAASLTVPFHIQPFGANTLRYAGISTLVYVFAKPILKKVGIEKE